MNTIKLLRLYYLPKELDPGILYVSEDFGVAGHLCPCGCGNKVITPLGTNEWSFTENDGKPSLYPSIGNWQLPCRSHYWVTKGVIEWSYQWTEKQIKAGRRNEAKRREAHYNRLNHKCIKQPIVLRLFNWFLRK